MNVEAASYLLEVSRYIHRNPIETKRPLVERLEEYRWSSYPAYRNKAFTPNWLIKDAVFSELGSGQPTAAYGRLVEGGVDEELAVFYAKGNWPAVLGSKGFVESAYLHSLSDSREIRKTKNYLEFDQVLQAVAKHFGCSKAAVLESKRGVRNEKRALAMKLAQEKTGETLEQLAKRFAVGSYGAVSQTVGRLNRLLEKDEGLKASYNDISRDLAP